MTPEKRAELEAQRERMRADARTRMPRVVRLSANEARTLDDAMPHERNVARTCHRCGHIELLHDDGAALNRCSVVDCECEVWNLDHAEQESYRKAERAELIRRAYSSSRWSVPLAIGVLAFALGAAAARWVW